MERERSLAGASFNGFNHCRFASSDLCRYQKATPMMHLNGTTTIQSSEQLEDLLSEPTEAVVEMMRRVEGDIILLGAGGKIGPSLSRMAKRASDLAGTKRRIIAVSRFSAPQQRRIFTRTALRRSAAICSTRRRSRSFRRSQCNLPRGIEIWLERE
jgi:hypothetical protein